MRCPICMNYIHQCGRTRACIPWDDRPTREADNRPTSYYPNGSVMALEALDPPADGESETPAPATLEAKR